ncbi:MAG: VTT domain-containing protein [Erysipelotrichaceae bacterium]
MSGNDIINYLNQYGLIIMFVIIIIEYLNIPFFPSGIVLPVVGFWVVYFNKSFFMALLLSTIAGIIGSMFLYIVGRYADNFMQKMYNKFPKIGKGVANYEKKLENNANVTIFVAKIIPFARTLVGFPAGRIKMNIFNYMFYSTLGIIVWNVVFMLVRMLAAWAII